MAGTAHVGADPDIAPKKEAPSGAPEESIEAMQRLQRVRANLRLPDRPFAAPSADYDAGLRALRLLDFVRLDLPSSGVPRPDLVAELIANYSSSRGWSSVRGKQIEISLKSFARALRLPPYGATTPAGSVPDGAAVTSATREFSKVYVGEPAEASTDVKRRLPSSFLVKNVKRAPEYTTELLWELLKQEMEHLIQSESTDWVSYYSAFLQRLIWAERPELFQPAPELSVAVAPAALCVRKEQGSNRATIHENQRHCSESNIHRSEASSKQIGRGSKKIDSASEINISASEMIETKSTQLEQAMESLDQALVTKEREGNGIDKSEASSKQIDKEQGNNPTTIHENQKQFSESNIDRSEARSKHCDMASKKDDSASEINIAASKMIETTSKQLEQEMESLDQALVTKEREGNDIDKSEASSKQIGMASKKIDSASKKRKQQQSLKTERRSPRLAGCVQVVLK